MVLSTFVYHHILFRQTSLFSYLTVLQLRLFLYYHLDFFFMQLYLFIYLYMIYQSIYLSTYLSLFLRLFLFPSLGAKAYTRRLSKLQQGRPQPLLTRRKRHLDLLRNDLPVSSPPLSPLSFVPLHSFSCPLSLPSSPLPSSLLPHTSSPPTPL